MTDVRFPILNVMRDTAPRWTRGALDARAAVKAWDEEKHPRKPRGAHGGGEFAPKGAADPDIAGVLYEKSKSRVLYFSQGDGSDLDKSVRLVTNTNAAGHFETGKLRVEIHDPDTQVRSVFERSMERLPAYVAQMVGKRYALLQNYYRKPSLLVKAFDETKHPRRPKGSGRNAGQFAPKSGVPITQSMRDALGALGYKALWRMVSDWVTGHDMQFALIAQEMAAERFGGRPRGKVPRLTEKQKELFRRAFDLQYEATQYILRKKYPAGYVTLYRGVENKKGKTTASNAKNALTSWSSDKKYVGNSFVPENGKLLTARIPIAQIWACPYSNSYLKNYGESEFVVLSGN